MTEANFASHTVWTGDNLHILRGLNSDTVDLIYLDPPFNSNKKYSAPIGSKAAGAEFYDTWHLSDLDVALMGLLADEHPSIAYLLDITGKLHGKGMQSYLTMMAVRLIEMHRILKPSGSIYLHCDSTAGHYLKLLMDAVFGSTNFRNDIVWQRNQGRGKGDHNKPRIWGKDTDTILFYAKTEDVRVRPYRDLSPQEADAKFTKSDKRGERYYTGIPLYCTPTMKQGSVYDWTPPDPMYAHLCFRAPHATGWRLSKARMDEEYRKGNVVVRPDGKLERRKYERDYVGIPTPNIWTDIPRIQTGTGYPTQKPLALLKRIIGASSNEGDMVLDPFCGCATACVAAQALGRKWVGIDLSPKAVELVNLRLAESMGSLFHHGFVTARTDVPKRTDIDAPKDYRKNAHVLYGQQEGECAGCQMHFPFKIFQVDHIIPQSRGGTDHIDNLQLLCNNCNLVKGDRPMEYLVARLAERQGVTLG